MFRGARNLSYVSLFTGMLLAFVAFLLFVNRATERVVPCFTSHAFTCNAVRGTRRMSATGQCLGGYGGRDRD